MLFGVCEKLFDDALTACGLLQRLFGGCAELFGDRAKLLDSCAALFGGRAKLFDNRAALFGRLVDPRFNGASALAMSTHAHMSRDVISASKAPLPENFLVND